MTNPALSHSKGPSRARHSVSDESLVSLFCQLEDVSPDRGLISVQADGTSARFSYRELFLRSARICSGLQDAGVVPGEQLLLQLEDAADVFVVFWGAILAGAVPVPLNPSPVYDRMTSAVSKLTHVWSMLSEPRIIALKHLQDPILSVTALESSFRPRVLALEDLASTNMRRDFHTAVPHDVAVLFLTSGSTGLSKGVPQTHAAILAMIDGTIQACGFTSDDITLNWMSLDHAGSLVFLGAMAVALHCDQVHVAIAYILQNPLRWLDMIHQHRASISWAPNFAFSLFLEKQDAIQKGEWDLRCMRFMVNAGEAIVSRTARAFIRLLQQHGLPKDALRPAFGMVETNSGITWSEGFTLDNSSDDDQFVDLGPCIPGCEMRVVDEAGQVLPAGQSGRFQLRGHSVFCGYYKQDELNQELFEDGWMQTGDLAMLRNGHLYITGREKDVIIINGNNFYCHEIESTIEQIDGITRGNVAACGARLPDRDTEQLVVFFHAVRTASPEEDAQLVKAIRSKVMDAVGVMPAALVPLEPGDFPRTEIGKIQRSKLRQQFEEGAFSDRSLKIESTPVVVRSRSASLDNDLADAIADIWRRVLNLETVSFDETFFELGGHSLLAFQVQQELETLLGRPVPIVELFTTPTIRSMVEHFGDEKSAPARSKRITRTSGEDEAIAVVGMACRFPGAENIEAFWNNLCDGVESITFYEAEDAIRAGLSPDVAHHPDHVHAVPFLDHMEDFDAGFWSYAPREARMIDPQQRIFLETAWEAFEDAGYRPGSLGRTGVFASAGTNTYLMNNLLCNRQWLQEENGGRLVTVDSMSGFNVMITNDKDYMPTRVSYKLDCTGPSVNVQTACSSTLVAIADACRSLRSGDCDAALAGGCAAMVPQHAGHLYSEGMIMSPDGHCRAYDADAKGTIFGSGTGAVLLKRLSDAEAAGDRIYAVIKGVSVVNDGGQKMGYTAPSLDGEYAAIRSALDDAGVPADSLSFVEGHGTGTPLGDPIEVGALTKAFREDTKNCQYCALGSVKTNIGHMGICSGIAGALKTILSLYHKKIPGTLHFRKANPQIDFESSPFYVNPDTREWETDRLPRRAGVNSLGIGGTNAHVIFEEAPEATRGVALGDTSSGMPELIPLSGVAPGAVSGLADKYMQWISAHPEVSLRDVGYTAQVGRVHFPVRAAYAGSSLQEIAAAMRDETFVDHSIVGAQRGVVFVFSGQGSQTIGMGCALYDADPVYKEALDTCCKLFAPYLDEDLLSVIRGEAGDLHQTGYTQPALFAIQVALVQALEKRGVTAAAVMGHSIGEYAAAWLTGILSLETAVRMVAKRSAGMQGLPAGGAMTAVFASRAQVEEVLASAGDALSLASSNAPSSHVISGDVGSMDAALQAFDQSGIGYKQLQVSHAFHSAAMDPMLDAFREETDSATYHPANLPFFSTNTGKALERKSLDSDYWVSQVRNPVLFHDAMGSALQSGFRVFLEIGPHPSLAIPASQCAGDGEIRWVGCLKRKHPDPATFVQSIADLYMAGCDIDWERANEGQGGRRVSLPTYAWQRERHWIEPDLADESNPAVLPKGTCPWLGRPLQIPFTGQTVFHSVFAVESLPLLSDHLVFDFHVPPGALYASQFLQAGFEMFGDGVSVDNLLFLHPMVVSQGGGRDVQVLLCEDEGGVVTGEIVSQKTGARQKSKSTLHAQATLRPFPAGGSGDLVKLQSVCTQSIAPSTIAATMKRMQVELGSTFSWIQRVDVAERQALAKLEIPSPLAAEDARMLYPGFLDSCWQVLLAAMPAISSESTMIPFCVDQLVLHRLPQEGPYWCHAVWEPTDDSEQRRRGHVKLMDADGRLILETNGLELRRVDPTAVQAALEPDSEDWVLSPVWKQREVELPASKSISCYIDAVDASQAAALSSAWTAAGVGVKSQLGEASIVIFYANCGTDAVLACQAFRTSFCRWVEHANTSASFVLYTESGAEDMQSASPELAPLHGMAAALRHEYPDRNIRQIDCDASSASFQLVAKLLASGFAFSSCLVRGGALYEQVLEKHTQARTDPVFSPYPDAVQVITGGTGALGLRIAAAFMQRGSRHIVLAARSKPTGEVADQIRDWNQAGCDVRFVACDLANAVSVDAMITTARKIAPIQCVIHAAGVREDGFAVNLSDDAIARVMQGKFVGAENLVKTLASEPPERLVFFSSVAALFGSAGQTAYAAANAGLDALAASCSSPDFLVTSINWGPWQEAGMAAEMDASLQERLRSQGYRFLPTGGALDAFFRVVASEKNARVVIASLDFDALSMLPGVSDLFQNLISPRSVAAEVSHSVVAKLVQALEGIQDKQAHIEHYLIKIISDLLQSGDQALDADKGLFDLGMDSLTAVEIKSRLERDSGLKLRSTLAFDYPTVRKMAAYLVEELGGEEPAGGTTADAADEPTEGVDYSEDDLLRMLEEEMK